jgi:hypothetical protein
VFRPQIRVWIEGPARIAQVVGLVDTGADVTLLPRRLGDLLAVTLDEGSTSPVAGLAGVGIDVSTGMVRWHLGEDRTGPSWSSRVGFVSYADPNDEAIILGHAGFLEYFVATFDGRARHLDLTPADPFPGTPDRAPTGASPQGPR